MASNQSARHYAGGHVMTDYTYTQEVMIDWIANFTPLEAEWSYNVDPGYRQTRMEPGEPPSVQDLSLRLIYGKNEVDCPEWLAGVMRPSDETLLEHAAERAICAAEDKAEYQRDMQMEAAYG